METGRAHDLGNNQGCDNSGHAMRRAFHGPRGLLIEGKDKMTSETYKPGMIAINNKFDGDKRVTEWEYQARVFRKFLSRAFPLYRAIDECEGDMTVEIWDDLKQLTIDISSICRLTFAESDKRALPGMMIPGRGDWTDWTVQMDDREPMDYLDFCSCAYDQAREVFNCSILHVRLSDIQRAVSFLLMIIMIETRLMEDGEHA